MNMERTQAVIAKLNVVGLTGNNKGPVPAVRGGPSPLSKHVGVG